MDVIAGGDARAIIWNIVGGAMVLLGSAGVSWARRKYGSYCFKQVYGPDVGNGFYLKYSEFQPPGRNTTFSKPKPRVPRDTAPASNLTSVASGACARGVAYVAHSFGRNRNKPPIIEADSVADERMDISFVALGGTNHRSQDVFEEDENKFLVFKEGGTICSRKSQRPLLAAPAITEGIDYGVIIKINPTHNPERTWICCAGFGEWGTSGAAWFLANRWNELRKFAGYRPFAYVTKTRTGSDDSTVVLNRFLTEEEVERAADGWGQRE